MKKNFTVPFVAQEIVWNRYKAVVEANSKEEAYQKVKKSICESNPFRDFNADWDGVNTVTEEVLETSGYEIGEDYSSSIEDVEEQKNPLITTAEKKMAELVMFRGTKEEIINKLSKIGNREKSDYFLEEMEENLETNDLGFNTNIGQVDDTYLDFEVFMLPTNKVNNFIITEVTSF